MSKVSFETQDKLLFASTWRVRHYTMTQSKHSQSKEEKMWTYETGLFYRTGNPLPKANRYQIKSWSEVLCLFLTDKWIGYEEND